ncbi:MAG: hypothetical protein IPP02_07525 [Chitinophagaceae bacterium]|jgi:hypothetical protein|nr:hypothetical protein [Chitinophagaceae bacterium]MBK8300876.1 hypothetical protein [Chitinophagaceae bacterium]MBK9465292.1 hypothetical protein [Chitinophagaceae bacterium]MBK9660436.1 hypothetical protein [Chitinophagaceae bacterium]MBK9938232.1 hypothetical protein [Chitinophagaceae bacterium]
MMNAIRRLLAIVLLSVVVLDLQAQPFAKETKPYKILTSGKNITIKSTNNINHIMIWTNGGNRLIEQRSINANNYSFTIPINGKFFFLMVGLSNGKIYTEKIGVQ